MNGALPINTGHVGLKASAVSQVKELIREGLRLNAGLPQVQFPEGSRDDGCAPVTGLDIDRLMRRRAERNRIFGPDLFSDPTWDLLLALYSSHLWQRRVSIKAVTIVSGLPATTALRWLASLEERGLVRISDDPLDGRRRFAELSSMGLKAMNEYFRSPDQ